MALRWTNGWPKALVIGAVMLACGAALLSACSGGGNSSVITCHANGGSGCGGPTLAPDSGSDSGSTSSLYTQLLNAKFDQAPKGYGRASFSSQSLDSTNRSNGVNGIVKVTFSGSSDYLLLAVYDSAEESGQGAQDFSNMLPSGSARTFLPFLPNADCATGQNAATCGIVEGQVLVVSVAPSGMNGASTLVQAGDQLAISYEGSAPNPSPKTAPASSGQLDACSLLTASEAESALQTSNITPRPDPLGNCNYQSASETDGGIEIQPEAGGATKYNFDKQQNNGFQSQDLSGIGDKAWAFFSAAGSTQVHILKGNNYVIVIVPGSLNTAKAVAKEVAGRM